MDVILEFFFEVVVELYFDFFQYVVPKRNISKGMRIFLTTLCAIVSLGILACMIVGVYLIIGGEKVEIIVGIVLLILASIFMIAHIVIALYNSKKKKINSQPLDKDDIDQSDE